MSIEKFHSSVQVGGETSALFVALRRLNDTDPRKIHQAEDNHRPTAWDPWTLT
jgi:hypothetical protein